MLQFEYINALHNSMRMDYTHLLTRATLIGYSAIGVAVIPAKQNIP